MTGVPFAAVGGDLDVLDREEVHHLGRRLVGMTFFRRRGRNRERDGRPSRRRLERGQEERRDPTVQDLVDHSPRSRIEAREAFDADDGGMTNVRPAPDPVGTGVGADVAKRIAAPMWGGPSRSRSSRCSSSQRCTWCVAQLCARHRYAASASVDRRGGRMMNV